MGPERLSTGAPDRREGREALAEDGSPSTLAGSLQQYQSRGGVTGCGAFATSEGSEGPGPLLPGHAYVSPWSPRPGTGPNQAARLTCFGEETLP